MANLGSLCLRNLRITRGIFDKVQNLFGKMPLKGERERSFCNVTNRNRIFDRAFRSAIEVFVICMISAPCSQPGQRTAPAICVTVLAQTWVHPCATSFGITHLERQPLFW